MERMRRSGYCIEAIDKSFLLDGSKVRIKWLEGHVKKCEDCANANYFKLIEHEIAQLLGAEDKFERGEPLNGEPGYKAAFDHVMMREFFGGRLAGKLKWMKQMAEKRGLKFHD